MEIQGRIKRIYDAKDITPSFKLREFVVTTLEQYPQDIIMQLTQDKTTIINTYKVGDDVTVHINVRGREWINPEGEAKYFNTIQAWKIDRLENPNAAVPTQTPTATQPTPTAGVTFADNGDDDDLPF